MELINMRNNKSIAPFNGDKYTIWKSRVRALIDESIMDRNALKILDSEERPNDIDEPDWEIWNKVAKGVIIRSLGDSVISYATTEPNISARGILMKLDDIYSRKSIASELCMEMKLHNMKYTGSTNLTTYFMLFDELIADMEAASENKLKESNKIARLLSTLPKTFGPLITAIQTLNDKELNLAFVKMRLLDYEIQINNENKDTSHKVLQTVSNNKNYKNNHNGYKANLKNKFKQKQIKCFNCGKIGHYKRNCYLLKNKNYMNKDENKTVNIVQNDHIVFMCDRDVNTENERGICFILDSGSSDHIINDCKLFDSYGEIYPLMKIGVAKNGTYIDATKRGRVTMMTNRNIRVTLEDVLLCEEVPNNLLSVRKLQEMDFKVIFDLTGVKIIKGSKLILEGNNFNKIPKVYFNYVKSINFANGNEYLLWHKRLGHIGKEKFLEIKRNALFQDVDKLNNIMPTNDLCEACIMGKQSRLKYQKAKMKNNINRPLFIVHTDVCGPITPPTYDKKKKNYFVLYIDEYTHYCVTYVIARKSDVFATFKDYNSKASAHFNTKITYLYSDNGTEYLSTEMKEYCRENGISYHLTVPHSPQLNGVAERAIRTLTEKSRSLINEAKLPKYFWGEAIQTSTYLYNRCPSKAIKLCKTPYEMWHSKKPLLKFLKIFGATVYVHNKVRKAKFDEKSSKGVLLGYEANGYRVWDSATNKVIVARDVIVDELNYGNSRPSLQCGESIEDHDESILSESMTKDIENPAVIEQGVNVDHCKRIKLDGKTPECMVRCMSDNEADMGSSENVAELNPITNNPEIENESLSKIRKSERIKNLPKISYNEMILSAELFISDIPKNYSEIKGRSDQKHWEKAVQEELNSLNENSTWTIVPRPTNKNIVGCRWVFVIKKDENGNSSKYKARLVAKGYSQEYLCDYEETFAPVARITSFRFLMAFANQNSLLIHHMDVKTAFLNGKLKEEIFMEIPEGIECKSNTVCKLNRSLYGLKQAARCWFETFESTLLKIGFQNSAVDRCIYVLNKNNIEENIYLILYVDDIVIATASIENMNRFKNYLKANFKMTDLKDIKLFLGIRVERKENQITFDQTAYINRILEKFKMQDCKAVLTPLPTRIDFELLNADEKTNFPCRNLIGSLMYVMLCTRPDLSVAVNIMSRYTHKNNNELWKNLKRLLRYLKGTCAMKLTYMKNDYKNILTGFVDSDWGGDSIDRKSTTGVLFKMFDCNTICWITKKQSSVAASSTEAEYMALYEAVREGLWLKSLAKSIGLDIENPIDIYEDNQGCIGIAKNPTSHKRSKHIDIKYHFSREQVEKNVINVLFISTEKQLADIMTKSLAAPKYVNFVKELGLK